MNANTNTRRKAWMVLSAAVLAGAVGGCASNRTTDLTLSNGREVSQDLSKAVALVARAQKAQKADKNAEAITLYQQAVEWYRDYPAAWNNMGVLMLKEQRFLEAAECFVNAQEMAPQDPRPSYNLGLTWDKAGYPSDALTHYQLSLQRDSNFLPALRGAARASWLLRRYNESSLDIVRTALMIEKNDQWRDWFQLENVRIQNELAQPTFTSINGSFNTP